MANFGIIQNLENLDNAEDSSQWVGSSITCEDSNHNLCKNDV